MYVLAFLTNLLPPRLRPLAKATWPAILTVVAVVVQWVATGEFDRAELVTTLTGLPAAILTYLVPNLSGRLATAAPGSTTSTAAPPGRGVDY